jgi:hypothetical protein
MPTPKFKPGQSGNPAGRPKDKTPATLLRKSIADDMPEIIKTLVELAKGGDVQAAKVLIDRICPPLRPQALPVNIEMGATLPETGGNILAATLAGSIPPDVGTMLIKALTEQGRLVELQEMAQRLERIEKLLEPRP